MSIIKKSIKIIIVATLLVLGIVFAYVVFPDENRVGIAIKESSSLINKEGSTVKERFELPSGFKRSEAVNNSFEEFLRSSPLKPAGYKVRLYDGRLKHNYVYEAVLDYDTGDKNLQQCADSAIRLRAEYLYKIRAYEQIHFNFTNGFRCDYTKWRAGYRIKVNGNSVIWVKIKGYDDSYQNFRNYLDVVFNYAGSLSLSKELEKIELKDMRIGDVFVKGGSPGHVVIVVDMCENTLTKKKYFMLAQGYMPAQDIHILKNLEDDANSPWYSLDFKEDIKTPEWTFTKDEFMRFN